MARIGALMVIHTNGPVNTLVYMLDRDHNPIEIDIGSTFKCQVQKKTDDDMPVLTFVSGGGSGVGSISIITDVVDGLTVDMLEFTAEQALVEGIEPGAYHADVLQTDDPDWKFDFEVLVDDGVTAP